MHNIPITLVKEEHDMDMNNLKGMSQEQLIALVSQLQKQKAAGGAIKVSEKGAVSLYGLGRLPVTLYKSQWDALFLRIDEVKEFIKQNESLLAVKAKPVTQVKT